MIIMTYHIYVIYDKKISSFHKQPRYIGSVKASSEDKAIGNFLAELEMKGKTYTFMENVKAAKAKFMAKQVI